MKKFFSQGLVILAVVLFSVDATMIVGGLGTTMSRLVLTVIVLLLGITYVKLICKKEKPTAAPTASVTNEATVVADATTAPATPTADVTTAPVADATAVSHDDVVSMIGELTRYYSGKSATIADETAYLQATDDLADTLKKTSELYMQAKQKRSVTEQRVEAINQLFNGGNQNP